jgi:hypothetical protein
MMDNLNEMFDKDKCATIFKVSINIFPTVREECSD